MPPSVSILLPAKSAAATLGSCVASIRRQSFQDWECVVVDDASADATRAIADHHASIDPPVRVVAGSGRGFIAALQLGLDHCRGALIARMDADDLMHHRRLEVQVEALEAAPRLAGVGSRVRLFPTAALGNGMIAYAAWLNSIASPHDVRREALVESPILHPTMLLRGPILRAFGFRDVGWPEDYDLILRLLAAGHDLAVVPQRLHAWRRGPSTLTAHAARYARARFYDLKAAFLADGFLRRHLRYGLWGFGRTGRSLGRALRALGCEPAFIVELHPRRLGTRIHGAEVIPPEALARAEQVPLVISVAGAANRALIRRQLTAMGRKELRDYVCTA